jgi:hypothetical protein
MNINNIFVFASNIKTIEDIIKVSEVLNESEHIIKWNIDQEDIDCVLRIESNTMCAEQIIELIKFQNFECKELA